MPQATIDITRITRDVTKSGGAMWRCEGDGIVFHAFDHDDILKNTFRHFIIAGYGRMLWGMTVGQVLELEKPIRADLVQRKGSQWWEVVGVWRQNP